MIISKELLNLALRGLFLDQLFATNRCAFLLVRYILIFFNLIHFSYSFTIFV